MRNSSTNIAAKTSELVENHSFVAMLLAVLCLAFAVNYFLLGPGSDGGSGLGGTGKFGGESGLGGTGKGPDFGTGFKLGATDTNESESYKDYLYPSNVEIDHSPLLESIAQSPTMPLPEFDVSNLRLSLADVPVQKRLDKNTAMGSMGSFDKNIAAIDIEATPLAENITFNNATGISQFLSEDVEQANAEVLVSSLDILNSLMLAEAQTRIEGNQRIADTANGNLTIADSTIRNRVSVPVRPERPDRFTGPARITTVQRIDIPAAPPVRPMRTLSTLLNR
jgi:hypothetical protein